MSKDRKRSWVIPSVSGFVIGSVITTLGAKLKAEEVISDVFIDQGQEVQRLQENTDLQDNFLSLPLQEKALDPEILKNVEKSLINLTRNTIDGYQEHMPSGFNCSGFFTRTEMNKPIVISAGHCLPFEFISEKDGKTYDASGEDGTSIFLALVRDANNEVFNGQRWLGYYFQIGENDLVGIQLHEDHRVTAPGLPINSSELENLDVYYLVRQVTPGETAVAPIRFLESSGNQRMFIDLGSLGESCIPGSSGSAIINRTGEVVSVISTTGEYELTSEITTALNIDPIHVGRIVRMCTGVSSSKILDLQKEEFGND